MNLGTHAPIIKDFRDGLLRIKQNRIKNVVDTKVDDWFDQDTSNLMAKMKVVAQFCQHHLGEMSEQFIDLFWSFFIKMNSTELTFFVFLSSKETSVEFLFKIKIIFGIAMFI